MKTLRILSFPDLLALVILAGWSALAGGEAADHTPSQAVSSRSGSEASCPGEDSEGEARSRRLLEVARDYARGPNPNTATAAGALVSLFGQSHFLTQDAQRRWSDLRAEGESLLRSNPALREAYLLRAEPRARREWEEAQAPSARLSRAQLVRRYQLILARYPETPQARTALSTLMWNYLDRGQSALSAVYADKLLSFPPNTLHPEELVHAAIAFAAVGDRARERRATEMLRHAVGAAGGWRARNRVTERDAEGRVTTHEEDGPFVPLTALEPVLVQYRARVLQGREAFLRLASSPDADDIDAISAVLQINSRAVPAILQSLGIPGEAMVHALAGNRGINTCALLEGGMVRCWKLNHGFDNDDYEPLRTPERLGRAIQITAGDRDACALLESRQVRCWGEGAAQLPRDLPRVTQISEGDGHHCAALESGGVRCWGYNAHGECNVPSLPGRALQIASGFYHNCALLESGRVQCWGNNGYHQSDVPPDLGRVTQLALGYMYSCALLEGGTVRCWGDDRRVAPAPPLQGRVRKLVGGPIDACAIFEDGHVQCWGGNDGRFQVPADWGRVSDVKIDMHNICAVLQTGRVRCVSRDLQTPVPVPRFPRAHFACDYFQRAVDAAEALPGR